jgi:hypothetical protein
MVHRTNMIDEEMGSGSMDWIYLAPYRVIS